MGEDWVRRNNWKCCEFFCSLALRVESRHPPLWRDPGDPWRSKLRGDTPIPGRPEPQADVGVRPCALYLLDTGHKAKYPPDPGPSRTALQRAELPEYRLRKIKTMSEGTIKRLTDKGFGFIEMGTGKDMFFHNSNVEGTSFEQLREGDRVSFTEGEGPKGPRAENVRVL